MGLADFDKKLLEAIQRMKEPDVSKKKNLWEVSLRDEELYDEADLVGVKVYNDDGTEAKWSMDDDGYITVDDNDPYSEPDDDEDDRYFRDRAKGKLTSGDFETFAAEAMRELVAAGKADFVLLKNDKLRAWWQDLVKRELAEQARLEAIARKKLLKEQALSKLSEEEKEALGLNRKR